MVLAFMNKPFEFMYSLQLVGFLGLELTEGGVKNKITVSENYTLWKRDQSSGPCPAVIPFACIMPSTYKDGDITRPLPPSYKFHNINFSDLSGMVVQCTYTISVVITKARKIAWWKRQKS